MCHSVTRSLLVAGIIALGGLTACSESLPQNSGLAMPDPPEVRAVVVRETGPPVLVLQTTFVLQESRGQLKQGTSAGPLGASVGTDVMASKGFAAGPSPGSEQVSDLLDERSTLFAAADPPANTALIGFAATVRLLV